MISYAAECRIPNFFSNFRMMRINTKRVTT